MVLRRVAVEGSLQNVKDVLAANGYEVVQLDPVSPGGPELRNCDAIVITGMDRNFAGYQDIQTKAEVIDATGMSAPEILAQIRQRLP